MASGDVYSLAIRARLGQGQDCITRLRYHQIGTTVQPGAEALAKAFDSVATALLLDAISANYVVDFYEVRQLSAPSTEGYDFTVNEGGHVSGQTLPPMDCVLVSWRTGLFGRRYHGRSYFPAPTEAEQDAGVLVGDTLDGWELVCTPMIQFPAIDGSSALFQLVIWHGPLLTPTNVNALIVRNQIATQRRRRAGVGS